MNQKQMMQFAILQLQKNKEIANSPMGQQFMSILKSGDQNAGEQMANRILNTYGKSREEGMNDVINSGMFR